MNAMYLIVINMVWNDCKHQSKRFDNISLHYWHKQNLQMLIKYDCKLELIMAMSENMIIIVTIRTIKKEQ